VCYEGGREKEIRKRKGKGEGWWCREVRGEKKGKKGEKNEKWGRNYRKCPSVIYIYIYLFFFIFFFHFYPSNKK
jgi:hypothetical protein